MGRVYQPEVPSEGIATSEVQVIMPDRDARPRRPAPRRPTSETAIAQTVVSGPHDQLDARPGAATSEDAIAKTVVSSPRARD